MERHPPPLPSADEWLAAQRQVQADWAAHSGSAPPLDLPLAEAARGAPVSLPAAAPLRQALECMTRQRIGSVLVVDEDGRLQGIVTRHDVLQRVLLADGELQRPLADVMSRPVHALTPADTVHDAAVLMARARIRHVPVVRDGVPVGIVSEHDLFALQRLSVRHVGETIAAAVELADFQHAAAEIRAYARHLMAQGVQPRQLTALIARFNDQLTQRLIEVELRRHGLDDGAMAWLALGSEGRGEQTLATDQDNALVFEPDGDDVEAARARWLAWARGVNEALDACGYPLCKGGIMAGNPPCCLTRAEWAARFARWIEGGSPQELLQASVFFDLRALAGRSDWVEALRADILARTRASPRFIRQLVQAHLEHGVPLTWWGGLRARREGAHRWLDLKLQGTALLVEAARILALAHGVAATGTRERLQAAGPAAGAPAAEVAGWVAAFDYLQTLRLVRQMEPGAEGEPNRLDVQRLNPLEQRMLRAALQVIRGLQQRLQLDYLR
ncbi:Inosine-5'-monophosphate dehydrogenase [Tepidimonas sediminis]|uniref:Inosine-5'-monophosphate dehydrogenase n=1 Tax=Tepidimonas sediminis TaxID=2588941 RepID=A0A554WQG5_9BURK|nr:DUF294 nucleotidyltransferase-like domain-containing protein [Tepidimonas sediminis]TSE25829.1 Inosine-5'-monophosphate dehydrogenase [Tepidimonas sediminis]